MRSNVHTLSKYKIVMKINFVLLLSGLIMLSCTKQQTDTLTSIAFEQTKSLPVSEVLETSFVKLSTSDDCLIGTITQAGEVNGQFLLLDGVVGKKLFLFQKDGNFLKQIGDSGSAPGEYAMPVSFSIDTFRQRLAIIDAVGRKVLYYDLSDYHFLFERKLPFSSSKMEWLSEDVIAWYTTSSSKGDNDGYIVLTDSAFQVKKRLLRSDYKTAYYVGTTPKLYKSSDCLSVYKPFVSEVYRIAEDSILLSYRLSFGNYEMAPIEFLKKEGGQKGNYIPALRNSSYIYYYSVFENDDLLLVPYYVDGTMYYGIHSKNDGKTYNYTKEDIQKDLLVGAFSAPVGTGNDNSFISLLRPSLLMELRDEGITLDERLLALLAKSKEEDNPILLIYTAKKQI